MNTRSLRTILSHVAGATMLIVSSAAAQQQVDPRVIQPVGGGAPVDTRVGRELYGNNDSSGLFHYTHQVLLLPSEVRYAIERSGAMPSEIRFRADQVGPLAPYGIGSYIPAESEFQRAVHAKPPILFGPAYGPQPQAPAPPPGPVPSAQVISGQAYVHAREFAPAPAIGYLSPQAMDASLPAGTFIRPYSSYDTAESIHNYPLLRRPTTAPTTQPTAAAQPSPSVQRAAASINQQTLSVNPR
jgi:hypothetical protein